MPLFARLRLGESEVRRERNGLWVLVPQASTAEGCVDVVAIHGLGGDAYRTWTHENKKLWLQDFLPSQVPEARILSYGYDSTVAFSKSSAGIDDFSRDFLYRLKTVRNSTQENARPIFFICHSLGGILFKQALNFAHQDAKNYLQLLESFSGVAFMGTPHGGSDVALWASHASRFLHAASLGTRTNKDLINFLRKDSKFLGSLSKRFEIQNASLQILTFYETEKFPMLNSRIVDKESALLKLSNEIAIPIQADHREMCRFSDGQDQKYMPVGNALAAMMRSNNLPLQTPSLGFSWYRSTLNEWLDPVPAIDDFNRIRSHRLEGSCKWVEDNSTYHAWLANDLHNILWLKGPPGCGKSTITTRMIEQLQSTFATAYFFCDFKYPRSQIWKSIVQTWTWQLLQQKSHLVDDVFNIYAETCGTSTPTAAFERALRALVERGQQCLLIVDGLDEARNIDRSALKQELSTIAKTSKILVVSRQEDWIVSLMPEYRSIDIRPIFNMTDIERFIIQRVSDLALDDESTKRIIDFLLEGTKGMFLWAELMIRHISQQTTPAQMKLALNEIPDGLPEVYVRLIRQINLLSPARKDFARRTLQWTFSAVRPLSIVELRAALAVQLGSHRENPDDFVGNLKAMIVDTCGPLLEVDEVKGVVRFVHASAMDFFRDVRNDSSLKDDVESLQLATDIRNAYSASICLTYLSYDNIGFILEHSNARIYDENLSSHLTKHSFLEYCAMNWWKHFPSSQSEHAREINMLGRSFERFASNQRAIVKWIQLFMLLDGPREGKLNEALSFRPRDVKYKSNSLSLQRSKCYFTRLYTVPNSLFSPWDRWITEIFFNGPHASPLGIASFFDFFQVVKSELARGLQIDVSDPGGFNPLLYAAHGDAADTVRFLLDSGTNVRATTALGYGAVRYASRNCTNVLPLILKKVGTLSGEENDEGMTPLHAVCLTIGWHPLILQELLKYCVCKDLDVADRSGRTPIHLAAAINIKRSVDLIVGRLGDDIHSSQKAKPLRVASAQEAFTPRSPEAIRTWANAWCLKIFEMEYMRYDGDEVRKHITILACQIKAKIVKLLLEKGPSIDVADDFGQTALHLAAENSFRAEPSDPNETMELDPIVQLLLDSGFSATQRDTNGRTPLDIALGRGHWVTAMTLLRVDTAVSHLDTVSRSQMNTLIREASLVRDKTPSVQSLFQSESVSKAYQSMSPLNVLQIFVILRSRLLACASSQYINDRDARNIVCSILDLAGCWSRLSNEVGLSNAELHRRSILASVTIGPGQVRKIEIYVARDARAPFNIQHSRFDSRMSFNRFHDTDNHFSFNYTGENEETQSNNSLPYNRNLTSSAYIGSMGVSMGVSTLPDNLYSGIQSRALFHKDGSLLQVIRCPKCSFQSPSTYHVDEVEGTTKQGAVSQKVSAGHQFWSEVRSQRTPSHPKYEIWKQVWPLRSPLRRTHSVGRNEREDSDDTEACKIQRWIENLQEGDTICLLASEEVFVQDVALFSRFGLAVSTAFV